MLTPAKVMGADVIHIELCGRLRLRTPAAVADAAALGGRRPRLAFACLVLRRGHPVSREELAAALWPDELPPTWIAAVRSAASAVRAFLELAGFAGESALVGTRGAYELRLGDAVEVDCELAERSVVAAETALRDDRTTEAAARGTHARQILARPFLAGETGGWVDAQRHALGNLHRRALTVLAEVALAWGEFERAITLGNELVVTEPLREDAHRLLMRAQMASGDRAQALQVYEACRTLLADELGVDPAPATRELFVDLLRADAGSATREDSAAGWLRLPAHLEAAQKEPPFAGRREARAALGRAWRRTCAQRRRRVVLVGGAAGIGKTRLAAEFARSLVDEEALVLYGRCDAGLQDAYGPVGDALDRLSIEPDLLAGVARDLAAELTPIVPSFARVLSTDLPVPAATSAVSERARLFDAVTTLLERLAERVPVLLILDDLQWATAPTLLLLRHVAVTDRPARLFVLGLARDLDYGDAGAASWLLAELGRLPNVDRTRIRPLEQGEVSELAVALAAPSEASARDAEALGAKVYERSGGNALFAVGLLRQQLTAPERAGVPGGVREMVLARLRRLPPAITEVLGVAAVVGHPFDLTVLSGACDQHEDAVFDAVDAAIRAGLVAELAPGSYRFEHDVVRQVLYEAITSTKRMRLHRRVGLLLGARADAATRHAARIAYHFTQSAPLGDRERAWLEGQKAMAALAFEDTAVHSSGCAHAAPLADDELRSTFTVSPG